MNIEKLTLKIDDLQKVIDSIRLEISSENILVEDSDIKSPIIIEKHDVIKKLTEVHTVLGRLEIVEILNSFDSAKSVSDIPVELYENLIEKCDLVLAGGQI
jgi:hypothetical protein